MAYYWSWLIFLAMEYLPTFNGSNWKNLCNYDKKSSCLNHLPKDRIIDVNAMKHLYTENTHKDNFLKLTEIVFHTLGGFFILSLANLLYFVENIKFFKKSFGVDSMCFYL